MENNEIMFTEENDVMDDIIVADEESGMSTGAAMLLGAGLTFAVGGLIKLGKKTWNWAKERKELRKPDKEIIVEPEDLEDIAK